MALYLGNDNITPIIIDGKGGGSTGDGADIIEAIVDSSALPIEKGKKVVVANVQASGQGAGALCDFDIVPTQSGSNDNISNIVQLHSEYPLHVNTNSSTSHIGYKLVGNKWEGKFFESTFSGHVNPNLPYNLIFTDSAGSDALYWNHVTNVVETIEFDFPFETPSIANTVIKYFPTQDGKYLWAYWNFNTNSSMTTATQSKLCIYKINVDMATGKIIAQKMCESIDITISKYPRKPCSALDYYGLWLAHASTSSSTAKAYTPYFEYDEDNNVIKYTENLMITNNRQKPLVMTKNWFLMSNGASGIFLYIGNPIDGFTQINSSVIDTTNYMGSAYVIKQFNDIIYMDSYGLSMIKLPLDKETPTIDDFVFKSYSSNTSFDDVYWVDENNTITFKTNQNESRTLPLKWNPWTNEFNYFDPNRCPMMLLDDGTAFFSNQAYPIGQSSESIDCVVPIDGSYNNGGILGNISYQNSGKYFGVWFNLYGYSQGVLPLHYFNNGDNIAVQTINTNSGAFTNASYNLFQGSTLTPTGFTFSYYSNLHFLQDEVIVSPFYYSATNYSSNLIIHSDIEQKIYTVTNYDVLPQKPQFQFFRYNERLFCYSLIDASCFEIILNETDMTATYVNVGNLSDLYQYYVCKSNYDTETYPVQRSTNYIYSVYNKPVITKDGKYILYILGKETTHYSKITENEDGLPVITTHELPTELKDLLFEQPITYFEVYYDKKFGIQLRNGTFLLCEYNEGIETDLIIYEYKPEHGTLNGNNYNMLFHFTSRANYWFYQYTYNGSNSSYNLLAGCGRREDLPSTYKVKIYSTKHNWHPADHNTGFLTGESYIDENGQTIARVRTLLG